MPWALASGQYPGPPHNSSYFSTPLQRAVLHWCREMVPEAGRGMRLAPERARGETHEAQGGAQVMGLQFPLVPLSFRLLIRVKRGQEETTSGVCAAIIQYVSALPVQLYLSDMANTPTWKPDRAVIPSLKI